MRRIWKTFSFKVFTGFWAVILCCILMVSTVAGRISSDTLKKNNYATANGLLNQVRYFYDSKFGELEKNMDFITNGKAYLHLMKENYYERYTTNYYTDIAVVLNNMQDLKQNYSDIIDSIYYYNEGYDLELYTIKKGPVMKIDKAGLFEMTEDTGSLKTGWISAHDETVFQTISSRKVISLYRRTKGTILCINLSIDIFQKELDYSVFGKNCYLAVLGNEEMMVSAPCEEAYEPDDAIRGLRKRDGWNKVKNGSGKELWVTGMRLDTNGWTVAAVMPGDYLRSEAGRIYRTVFLWAAVILFFASVLAYFISRSVTEPVRFITRQMQKVQQDNLDVDFSLKDKESELGIMAETLNQMEHRMIGLIERAKEQERLHKRLEIAVLQAQINPHFLYNTLASAQGLIHERENDRAEYLLQMLVVFFRTGLGRGSNKVKLADELAHVRSYLEIQKMRYDRCFEYEIDAEEELWTAEVIKLSLQPVIENAIYHGVKEKPGQRVILISAVREKDILKICVFDDGAGMSKKRLLDVREEMARPFGDGNSSVTYGIRNVNQRLILEYGSGYGLDIESVEGEYTMVTMRVPYRDMEG